MAKKSKTIALMSYTGEMFIQEKMGSFWYILGRGVNGLPAVILRSTNKKKLISHARNTLGMMVL